MKFSKKDGLLSRSLKQSTRRFTLSSEKRETASPLTPDNTTLNLEVSSELAYTAHSLIDV